MNLNLNCQICKDKKSASMKLNDAERILRQVDHVITYAKQKGYDQVPMKSKFIKNGEGKDLCHSYQHVMCGSCPEINRTMSRIHVIEEELSQKIIYLHYVLIAVKETDKNVYGYIKSQLSLSGYYPKAARLISII